MLLFSGLPAKKHHGQTLETATHYGSVSGDVDVVSSLELPPLPHFNAPSAAPLVVST